VLETVASGVRVRKGEICGAGFDSLDFSDVGYKGTNDATV